MTTVQPQEAEQARRLREAMVQTIIDEVDTPLPEKVLAALRQVPRHRFTPGVDLERAYGGEPIVTKVNERGVHISSVSAPRAVAVMLALLDVRPGHRVLEIGSGGYNAALLAHLVGPDGAVTSVDIDADVIERARACLDASGYDQVRTVCADGELGMVEDAPFDRIIVTVGAWDIPPAWRTQLAPDGRLVLPLRTRGMTYAWALEADGPRLVSRLRPRAMGFVPIQGAGEHRGTSLLLEEDVNLWLDEADLVGSDRLHGVLTTPAHEVWSGVAVAPGETFGSLELYLLARPGFARLVAQQSALERKAVRPSWRMGTPALVTDDSIAYRAELRPTADGGREFGAIGHGPCGAELTERLAEHFRTWDRTHRHGAGPQLSVHPAGDTIEPAPGSLILRKLHTTIVVSWADPVR
ncbi:methyltransferase, FxLD system [Mangrovactinospora gilvigrisea]|uniref:Protein-L-isoaspartate O-methyltransferase n=1 Tax=Mangrovactinospora gilvigrisea TaxID=1428644 RepID=A0A1J7BFH4_9ACTN|nr:methyltransferase, FxLD system [Mangrovactinospora gilvigrisea]OIV37390.1 methyltransferase, FxLD system [Mangrovactinospora gilvigrisea]